jgi:hypothetical protein
MLPSAGALACCDLHMVRQRLEKGLSAKRLQQLKLGCTAVLWQQFRRCVWCCAAALKIAAMLCCVCCAVLCCRC